MADVDCTCNQCGSAYQGRSNSRYCSSTCKWKAADSRRAQRVRAPKPLRGPFECMKCSARYYTRRPNGEGESFCSQECGFAGMAAGVFSERHARARVVRTEICSLRAIRSNWLWRPSPLVVAETEALIRIAKHRERLRLLRLSCDGCGKLVISPTRGKRKCGDCLLANARETRKRVKKSPAGRARKSLEKARRRAREQIDGQAIDPMAVFMRDGWRCHICKGKTPKELRGTFKDAAPELDHITTLADGGHHTWANVACACRKCNSSKGAQSLGQMVLGWAA